MFSCLVKEGRSYLQLFWGFQKPSGRFKTLIYMLKSPKSVPSEGSVQVNLTYDLISISISNLLLEVALRKFNK
eukprot:UN25436